MKILIDMNLSPHWCEVLVNEGWDTTHWSSVAEATAPDEAILQYAKENDYIVLTHDLDFTAILAATGTKSPSVIQVRTQDVLSMQFRDVLVGALRQFQCELETGALIVVDDTRSRVRLLPLK